jgi:hypothetical protein
LGAALIYLIKKTEVDICDISLTIADRRRYIRLMKDLNLEVGRVRVVAALTQ